MTIQRHLPAFLLGMALLFWSPFAIEAKTADPEGSQQSETADEKGGETPEPARLPGGVFENLRNNVSQIDFYSSNFGILFLDIRNSRAGGLYPRGSSNRYLFGGGIWFGAKKFVNVDPNADPDDPNAEKALRPVSVISYNPNSGASWMVPGEITQPYRESTREETAEAINKYRIYFSTDYNSFTGRPIDPLDIQNGGPNWPIWDTDPDEIFLRDRYVGRYVSQVDRRNRQTFPKGPAIVSGEDIITIFKDTDLSRYEIGEGRAAREGYPIGIQFDQRIYSWGFGQYGNFIFIRYEMVNMSNDTLYDCYTAPALDTDIGDHRNDRTRTVIPEADQDSLDLGAQWSENTNGDVGFGYMGADFLESPAIYRSGPEAGFIRKDKKFYTNEEQLGLHTLRNWVIDIDPRTPQDRYAFMAGDNGTPVRDGDNGAGDKRFLMSTGPFNMRPGDTARVVIAVLIAPAKNPTNPDGTWEDMDSLITLDLFAQKVYDENFLAPKAPDRANVSWRPLDNGVELSWDSTSEISIDVAEPGLDFLGYVIRRGRKPAGQGVNQYDSVVGFNLGFKTIATIPMPPLPTPIARIVAARNQNLAILGPWWRLPMLADTIAGQPAFQLQQISCFDTLKRQGRPDSIIERPNQCLDSIFGLDFDPYDDENADSTLYNNLSGRWWNDGSWGDRFTNRTIRDIVREAIIDVMDSISNGRTYIDVGDDNGDGQITATPGDLSANEKLINNIDYYYQVLAYDQGSPDGSTPRKLNTGVAGINEVRATPEAPPAGREVTPEVISTSGLGGISNFQLIVFDNERLGQLFGGDTLEFEFQPFRAWNPGMDLFFFPYYYGTEVIVRSRTLGEVNRFVVNYENRLTDRATTPVRNVDTTFVSRWDSTVRSVTLPEIDGNGDTVGFYDSTIVDSFYIDNRDASALFSNTFATEPGSLIFGTNGITKSTIGVSFDWTALFMGDSLRFGRFVADSNELLPRNRYLVGTSQDPFEVIPAGGSPNTNLAYGQVIYGNIDPDRTLSLIRSIPSYGNALIEIEFVEGGTERLQWEKSGVTYTIDNARYLVPRVRNVQSFTTDAFGSREARTIDYDYSYPADDEILLKLDTAAATTLTNLEESARLVDDGEFVMLAYDWTNTADMTAQQRRTVFSRATSSKKPSTEPVGTPNRYYVGEYTAQTSSGGTADVRFTHRVIVNGASFYVDFAGMGGIFPQIQGGLSSEDQAKLIPDVRPTTDFSAGDKIRVNFAGGTIGLPQPGAKIVVAIPDPEVDPGEFTDELLDEVTVVPNPYLVDHIGQRTTAEKKLYFTRLPEICTIEIYTVAGELVKTIEHSAIDNPDGRVAVSVWELLTSADRRADSQLLVARITTPSGAETIKKFSIVVGGFRLLTD